MANKKTLTPTSLPASLTLPEERKAEKALLFGLLASRKSLPEIAFRIRPEMFTHPDIALAIEAYLSLHGKGEGTDILSVEKEIRRVSLEPFYKISQDIKYHVISYLSLSFINLNIS